MKRKLSYAILICLSLLMVSSLVVYAAFVMTHNYEANLGYHKIVDSTLTTSEETLTFDFNEPGSTYEFAYKIKNNDTRNHSYYYSFTIVENSTDENGEEVVTEVNKYNRLFDMIYVYQNGTYCGTLTKYVYEDIYLKQDLPLTEYIFANEERTTTFKLELHNGSTEYTDVPFKIKVKAHLVSTNYQRILYATDSSDDFTKIIDDINSDAEKTIVLTNELVTEKAYTINKNCTIDLCGNKLTLGGNITIGAGVEVVITDSRGNGSIDGANIVLDSVDSFVKLETAVSNIEIGAYNQTRLIEELRAKYQNDGFIINSNESYDLLGNYSVYGITPSSSEVTIDEGVIQPAATLLDTNEVISVVYYQDTTNETVFEFKYIGSDNAVFESILNSDLAHMKQFAQPNGIQVANHTFLPTVVKEHNATISWHSSNPNIVDENGIIGSGQGNVVLTATIKVYDKVFIQKYYIYVVQQDNLSKLQYLASQVEKGVTLKMGTETTADDMDVNVVLTSVGVSKPLPIAGETNKNAYNYYTNWTDGKLLGIMELNYEVSNVYDYISLSLPSTAHSSGTLIEDKILTDAKVYLNKITYSRAAMVKIKALFDNGDIEETYITIRIDLAESTLADSVFGDIQTYLNSVNVLQNILNTRAELGTLNESGDFELPKSINVIELDYESKDTNLYSIVRTYIEDPDGDYILDEDDNFIIPQSNAEGQTRYSIDKIYVHFNDLAYLSLADKSVDILVKIKVISENQETYPATKTLRFVVPGAITPKNILDSEGNVIFNLSQSNIKRIFYTFKYQTLQQSDSPIYSVTTVDGVKTTTMLTQVANASDLYALGQYILMYDIQNTERLIFEYNSNEIIIDYYDLNTFGEIIKWATLDDGLAVKVLSSDFSLSLDSGIGWIPSDGKSTLSDEEITVILAYAERFPGFLEMWNQTIKVLDNTLSDNDINQLLELLIKDRYFVPIINWLEDGNSTGVNLYEWLYMIDESSPVYDGGITEITDAMKEQLRTNTKLPDLLLSIGNGSGASVTNDEERVIVYYVMANYGVSSDTATKAMYSDFYTNWKNAITRSAAADTTVNSISTKTTNSYYYKNSTSHNPTDCYDPIFTAIINWSTLVNSGSSSNSNVTLDSYLNDLNISNYKTLFTTAELEYKADWYYLDYYLGTSRCNVTTANEWSIIVKYLSLYGITEVTFNNTNVVLANVQMGTSGTVVDEITFTLQSSRYCLNRDFINSIIGLVNAKYTESIRTEYNNLVSWAKNTTVALQAWNQIVTSKTISSLDNYRIKDCKANISYDEWLVLTEYFKSQFTTVIPTETLRNILMGYYISSNLEILDSTISDSEYSNILSTINDNVTFEEMVEAAKTLGSSAPASGSVYDNLTTLSANELKAIAEEHKGTNNFITTLNSLISAYDITLNSSNNVVVTAVTAGVDRDLSTADQTALTNLVNSILGKSDTSLTYAYDYLSVGQIKNIDVSTFNVLTYYTNLNDLMFRGSSSVFLFGTSNDANSVFNIVTNSCSALEKLTINYAGLSDITSASKLLTLEHLDLRGNYTKGNYKGISEISSLILLTDLKKIANSDNDNTNNVNLINYLNVYNTDVLFSRAEVVLATLYDASNDQAALWYSHDGLETKYPKTTFATDDELAYHILSLLYEIDEMNGNHIMLPSSVYALNTSGTSTAYSIMWSIKDAKSVIKMNTSYNRIDRITEVTLTEPVQVMISASVTVNGKIYTRYFVITVS